MRIATKLPVFVVLMVLGTGLSLGVFQAIQAADGFEEIAQQKYAALAEARKSEMEHYLQTIEADMKLQSGSPNTVQALRSFTGSWKAIKTGQMQALQKSYITDNPNPIGEKDKLNAAPDGRVYDDIHRMLHPYFRKLIQLNGYYDLFLVDPQGNVIYSVFKEDDYATNLIDGKYADSGLATVFTKAIADPKRDQVVFDDYKPYAPSHGAPAGFVGAPVFNRDNEMTGVLIIQMPVGKINDMMGLSHGLGETGETYLVGPDKTMRSDSRLSTKPTILSKTVNTHAVTAALAGQQGVELVNNAQGEAMISAYMPMDVFGVRWAIIAEIEAEEALAKAHSIRNHSLIVIAAILVIGIFLALRFSRELTGAIACITHSMKTLADGDTQAEVPYAGRQDELGEMAAAVQVFKDNAIKRMELEAEDHKRTEQALARQEKLTVSIEAFSQTVTEKMGQITNSVGNMHQAANVLSGNAAHTQEQSAAAASVTEQAAANVQTVSAASTEMNASIEEISRQTTESNAILNEAVQQVGAANGKVESLAAASAQITEIVALITDIADQTNLLALNATIEAARAGDAGKGFAVVASEVKNLANQTARATEDIRQQIQRIQAETNEAVSAIQAISEIVGRVSELSTSIASALEQQSASTAEISRNVEEAAHGTQEVSSNIVSVTQAAHETGNMAQTVFAAANELQEESNSLQAEIDDFLDTVHRIQNEN